MMAYPMKRGGGLAVSLVALAMACGGGATEQTSAKLGTQGGQVSLGSGLTLKVPAGALTEAVAVTVRETRHGPDREIELEPHGLALAVPATLSVSDDGTGELEHESGEHLEGARGGGQLEAQVSRFERLRVRHGRSGDGGLDDRGGHGEHADGGEVGDDRGEHADGGEAGDDHGEHADGGEAGDDHGGMGGGGGDGSGGHDDGGTSGHGGH